MIVETKIVLSTKESTDPVNSTVRPIKTTVSNPFQLQLSKIATYYICQRSCFIPLLYNITSRIYVSDLRIEVYDTLEPYFLLALFSVLFYRFTIPNSSISESTASAFSSSIKPAFLAAVVPKNVTATTATVAYLQSLKAFYEYIQFTFNVFYFDINIIARRLSFFILKKRVFNKNVASKVI